jgi:feruloyl esterase
MKRSQIIRACTIGALAVTAAWPAGAQNSGDAVIEAALKCGQLTELKLPNSTLAITKAEAIPDAPPNTVQVRPPLPDTISVAVPSYCRAEGVIDQRVGVEDKPYAIGFAIALPDRWNGRFLFQGGGGLNGTVRPPIGAQRSV